MYKELSFKTWKELKEYLSSFNSNWIFRGQSNYNWKLESAIDRISFKSKNPDEKFFFERFYIRNIKRNPDLYTNRYSVQSDFQALSLLQYYGMPTRLLDFTTSPYVAVYFAIIDSEQDSSIYILNYFELLESTMKLFKNKYHDDSPELTRLSQSKTGFSDDEMFKDILLGTRQWKFVDLVQPYFLFDRMIQQNGAFLCQGDINVNFEENLMANQSFLSELKNPSPYYKIKIKQEWKDEMIRDLISMNITSATLFPGIEGHLKSLKNQFEIYTEDRGETRIKEK